MVVKNGKVAGRPTHRNAGRESAAAGAQGRTTRWLGGAAGVLLSLGLLGQLPAGGDPLDGAQDRTERPRTAPPDTHQDLAPPDLPRLFGSPDPAEGDPAEDAAALYDYLASLPRKP